MNLGDVHDIAKIIENGGPDVIFLLLVGFALLLTDRLFFKREITVREEAIARLTQTNDKMLENTERQQDLFDQAIGLIKEQSEARRR